MSLSGDSILNRDNLNRAYISKSATGTQIMAGSLRFLGGVTIDGVTTLGAITVGTINAGASAITTTGTVTAGTFSGAHSGVGTLLTALNGTNISSGTVADLRLSTNVVMLNKAQTFTANNTYSATANLYFAGGTTYKIDTTGSAYFNALQVAGNVNLDGNDYISFGSAGVAGPADISVGTKIKLYGNHYQIGIEGSSIWHDSANNHKFYTNNGTATRTIRAEITDVDTHIFTDLNVDKNLDVSGEFKAGIDNEFPDPLLISKSIGLWNTASNGALVFDAVQIPTGTGAVGSLKLTASAADAFSYSTLLFDTNPNEWFTYSMYNFCTTASKLGDLYIQWLDASQVHISYSGVSFTASTGWTRQRLTAQAPATARYFKIRIGNGGGAGAVMYYSAFQIERGKTLTGFKAYSGGAAGSFFDKGIVVGSGGEIHSGYNNAYILKDFGNSNVTLSAAGGTLHIGYNNTSKVILSTALYGVNATTQIAGTDGTLYYQGVNTDSRYVNTAGDSMTGTLSVSDSGATLLSVTRTATVANVGISYSNSLNSLHAGAVLGAGSADFTIAPTADLTSGKFKVNVATGEITVNGNKVWHLGNDGSGSGLDADLLDGLNSLSYMRTDANTSTTGTITIGTGTTSTLTNEANGELKHSNAYGYIGLGPQNATWAHIYTDRPSFYFNKELYVLGNKVWNAANDGAGSGLDADTVDGVQLAGLVQTSRTLTAGTGISGGGTLAADRAFAFDTTWGDARYVNKSGDTITGQTTINPVGAQDTLRLGRTAGYSSIKSTDPYLLMESAGAALGLNWYSIDNVIISREAASVTGIGTDSPTAKLHVDNDGQTRSGFYANTGLTPGTQTLFEHKLNSVTTPYRIQKSGYLGNADMNGILNLHLNSNVVTTGINLFFTGNSSTGVERQYAGVGGRIVSNTNAAEQGELNFHTMTAGAIQTRMTISHTGKVGIGSAPHSSYGLNVDSVITNNWFRSSGSTGWLNETYGGGWNMSDATWIRTYGSKSIYMNTGTFRTDGNLQVGATGGLNASGTVFNWQAGTLYSATVGKVSINQATNNEHPLHVKSDMSYQGINIQSTADANVSGLSFENASGSYTWHMAKSSIATADLVFYSGLSASMSALTEKLRFKNAGGIDIKGTIEYDDVNRYWLSTASSWGLYWNTTLNSLEFHGAGVSRFSVDLDNGNTDVAGTLNVVGNATADNYLVTSGNGEGLRFWASTAYSVYMSTTADATYGGQVSSAPVGDYNMYFKMTSAGRGFVFKTNSGAVTQIEEGGKVHAEGGFRTKKYEMVYNATEDSLDFVYVG